MTLGENEIAPLVAFNNEIDESQHSLLSMTYKPTMEKMLFLILGNSINRFFEEEIHNILNDVAERNLCARLAIYFTDQIREHKLAGYYADPEYNRKQGGQVKTILDDRLNIITIQSDLIIHSRGAYVENDNLIAIEMKKANRSVEEKNADRDRLRAMTKDSYDEIWSADGMTHPEHVCGYILGVYLILDIRSRTCIIEYYRKGAFFNQESIQF